MRDWITLALVAAAFTLMGVMGGVAMTPAPKPAPVVKKVPGPTVTATVRVTERATRSKPRRDVPATGVYQEYAKARVSAVEWPCLRKLWERESNWNPNARNGSHYGIAQRRGETNTDYRRQIELGLSYIQHRYSGPCDALAHSDRENWY